MPASKRPMSTVTACWCALATAMTTMRASTRARSSCALLAAALATGTGWLAAALAVGGLANAVGQPAGNATLAQHVSADRFGIAFAVKQSGIPVATLLGGLAVPAVALTIGWRWAFAAGALLAVAAKRTALFLLPGLPALLLVARPHCMASWHTGRLRAALVALVLMIGNSLLTAIYVETLIRPILALNRTIRRATSTRAPRSSTATRPAA